MINVYKIKNNKFKSMYFSINFTMILDKKEISENAVLSLVMAKSCNKYKSQKEIVQYLYSLYGANFDVNIEKFGDLYNLEFRAECINKKYLPNNEDVVDKILQFLNEVIFNPNVNNLEFNSDLVEREKTSILEKINAKKDDKLRYGVIKTEELMCEGEPFGEYIYGNIDDVNTVSPKSLYNRYNNMLNNSCINVIVSGNLDGYDDIDNRINNVFPSKLDSKLKVSDLTDKIDKNNNEKISIVLESEELQDTTQSVITYGMDILDVNEDDFYTLSIYNAILGGTPSSKLFQNFREKESLAYTVRSRYYRFKDMIIIYAGIEKKNYEKAKKVLDNEIKQIELGNITDEEFNSAIDSTISDLKEWNDSKIALSKMFIANLFATNSTKVSLQDMIDRISKVNKQDVIDISKKIIKRRIFLLGGVGDE